MLAVFKNSESAHAWASAADKWSRVIRDRVTEYNGKLHRGEVTPKEYYDAFHSLQAEIPIWEELYPTHCMNYEVTHEVEEMDLRP